MNSNQIFEFSKTPHAAAELLDHPSFSHTRLSRWWDSGDKSIWVYFRCTDSPSGVLSAGSFPSNPENDALMRGKKIRANNGPSRGDIACRNLCGTTGF